MTVEYRPTEENAMEQVYLTDGERVIGLTDGHPTSIDGSQAGGRP
jgi:hypothetical protein